MNHATSPLAGVRVLDLSRILAGPAATQLLGDLGADIIKIERPGVGDDTRRWGPPWLRGADGTETSESAYFLSANRNKRSVTLDLAQPEGQALARRLAGQCDVLVENFKVGDLARFGLDYASLKDALPSLVYCSISGFGQSGPYASLAGYDFMVQGMGGIMSLTGEPDGQPMKVGVAVADVVCGLYASNAILAALMHRDRSGQGQFIDLSLLDTQVAWLVNQGLNYLTSGTPPMRLGNAHPNIVPYQVFAAADGHFILAVGNDTQFQRFAAFAGAADLAHDPRFATNPQRVRHRSTLVQILDDADPPAAGGALAGRAAARGRAVRPGQRSSGCLRRPAGASARDADRDGAPAGSGRNRGTDRQPDPLLGRCGGLHAAAAPARRAYRRGSARVARSRCGRTAAAAQRGSDMTRTR